MDENKNYQSYLNPFFQLNEKAGKMIPNPFFPEKRKEQEKKYKDYLPVFKNGFKPDFDKGIKNSLRVSLMKQSSRKTIKENNQKVQNGFLELKENVIAEIYNNLLATKLEI